MIVSNDNNLLGCIMQLPNDIKNIIDNYIKWKEYFDNYIYIKNNIIYLSVWKIWCSNPIYLTDYFHDFIRENEIRKIIIDCSYKNNFYMGYHNIETDEIVDDDILDFVLNSIPNHFHKKIILDYLPKSLS